MKKIPRPPVRYSYDVAVTICDRHARGETLNAICGQGDPNLPTAQTFLAWCDSRPEIKSLFENAKILFIDALVDQAILIADTAIDSVRARNQITIRQWIASKGNPIKFGDRVQVDIEQKISLTNALEQAKTRLLLPDTHTINVTPSETLAKTDTYEKIATDYESDASVAPQDWADFLGEGGGQGGGGAEILPDLKL